jgi:glyoxylase-like metal-dependent hydrolase (beta-lactamase superfamily II)
VHYAWEWLSDGVARCRLPFLDVTVGLVQGSEQLLLVDCGTTLTEAERIAEDVAQLLDGAVVTRVVLTHHHFDHVLGSGGFTDAEICAASAVGLALTTGIDDLRSQAVEFGADRAEVDRAAASTRPPDRQVLQARIDLGGRVAQVEHVGPGHTDHDLVVVVVPSATTGRRVVFCGDLVEESADPSIDAESDIDAWPAALDRILDLGGPDAIFVPGHGAVVDAAFVRRQRDWLAAQT